MLIMYLLVDAAVKVHFRRGWGFDVKAETTGSFCHDEVL